MNTVSTPRTSRRQGQDGFSLIELLIVVTIISIIAALAQPQLHGVLVKARAAEVVGAMDVVKTAVVSYQSTEHAWPAEVGAATTPPELAGRFLPDGFQFVGDGYTLDFENWGGTPFNVGVAIVTDDAELGAAVLELLRKPVFQAGNKYHWVID